MSDTRAAVSGSLDMRTATPRRSRVFAPSASR
ncbi:MAG: hypothetical protein JWN61_195, partial [Pseudonocardiales bacterium]|nr:hypothetical protein [Pseudonocardiales bacterium]